MASTVCVCNKFTVTNGELCLNVGGNPAAAAWPYSCAMTSANGLHATSAGELWVDPARVGVAKNEVRTDSPNHITQRGETYRAGTLQFTVANPSSCYAMGVSLYMQIDFDMHVGDNGAVWDVAIAYDRDAPPANVIPITNRERAYWGSGLANGADTNWKKQVSNTIGFNLAPAASSTIRVQAVVNNLLTNLQGTVKYNTSTTVVTGIGIPI